VLNLFENTVWVCFFLNHSVHWNWTEHPTIYEVISLTEELLNQLRQSLFNSLFFSTTHVSQHQKGKTILDFNEARDDGGSGISWTICISIVFRSFSVLTLFLGWQEGHMAHKKNWVMGWRCGYLFGAGADLHMAQLKPLPLTLSCFSKIQTGFTFLVLAHLGSPGQKAIKWLLLLLLLLHFVPDK